MTKDTVLLIGIDLGSEKDCQCATLDLYYNETDHIIYQTFDKEQVAVLKEIMEEVAKEKAAVQRLEAIDNANPSEALERLEKLGTHRIEYKEGFELGYTKTMPFKSTIVFNTIKHALIKAQEQENDKLKEELTKYKNLEEEIGCPLKVRCEVVPNSYIYTFGTSMETLDVITRRKVITINKEGIYISYATASGKERDMTLPWKAYKKTWWLKKDKSE